MTTPYYQDDLVTLHHGDCVDVLRTLPDESVHAVVTDPPYELGYAGKAWDSTGIAFSVEMWQEVLRVLKPGGWLLAFGGTRTWHRLACAVEDAGFILRDQIAWLHREGMPYATDAAKVLEAHHRGYVAASGGVQKATQEDGGTLKLGDEAQKWDGWMTALKPLNEPILMAQRPLDRTIANNVDQHGCGPLNIGDLRIVNDAKIVRCFGGGQRMWDGCPSLDDLKERALAGQKTPQGSDAQAVLERITGPFGTKERVYTSRWPPNVLNDGSFGLDPKFWPFFECKKAQKRERPRVGNFMHHTVKPLALMRWLITLVSPPGAIILDPFAGSGTTLEAAMQRGVKSIGIEKEEVHLPLIMQRIDRQHAAGDPILPPGDPRDFKEPKPKKTDSAPERTAPESDTLPLFGDAS